MKLPSRLVTLIFTLFLSFSAATGNATVAETITDSETPVVYPLSSTIENQHKLNFFQRLMYKLAVRKFRKADTEQADSKANTSLAFGLSAMAALLIGLAAPYVIFATIPLGIVAMVFGKQALNAGTSKPERAKIGKAFGLASIITFAAILVLAAIVLSTSDWW